MGRICNWRIHLIRGVLGTRGGNRTDQVEFKFGWVKLGHFVLLEIIMSHPIGSYSSLNGLNEFVKSDRISTPNAINRTDGVETIFVSIFYLMDMDVVHILNNVKIQN
jgi:hypothetical protein